MGAETEDKRAAARSLPGCVKLWLSVGSVGLSIATDLQVLSLKISGLAHEKTREDHVITAADHELVAVGSDAHDVPNSTTPGGRYGRMPSRTREETP